MLTDDLLEKKTTSITSSLSQETNVECRMLGLECKIQQNKVKKQQVRHLFVWKSKTNKQTKKQNTQKTKTKTKLRYNIQSTRSPGKTQRKSTTQQGRSRGQYIHRKTVPTNKGSGNSWKQLETAGDDNQDRREEAKLNMRLETNEYQSKAGNENHHN